MQCAGYVSKLEVYDPGLDAWQSLNSMPTARSSLGLAAIGSMLYSGGGINAAGTLNKLEVYKLPGTSLPPA